MSIKIVIHENNNVKKLLNNLEFLKSWQGIAEQNNHPTLMQESEFVENWYNSYSREYSSILILGFNKTELIGIIPLAFKENTIIHAGGMQAEYHGWICEKEFEEEFLVNALIDISKKFNVKKWNWGWIPPRANTNWINSSKLKKVNVFFKLDKQKSPVLNLTDQEKVNKLKKSRSLKTKINRYKKRGEFYLKKITSVHEAEEMMPMLEKQCDFRKIYMNHEPPFIEGFNRRKFILDRLKNTNSIHFTVLMLNETPIAFHIGECDEDTVYLTIISHDAVEARNSPGKILLIKLIELLQQEGYNYFDLTPGGDSYKETYANEHQNLTNLTIFFNKKGKIVSDINYYVKNNTKRILLSLKIEPSLFSDKVSEAIKTIRKLTTTNTFKLFYTKEIFCYYKLTVDRNRIEELKKNNETYTLLINRNQYSDFLIGLNNENWKGKASEFSYIQKRLDLGNILFTAVKNNKLLLSGWFLKKRLNTTISNERLDISQESVFIGDFKSNSDSFNTDDLKPLIKKMIVDSYDENHTEIFLELSDENIKNLITEIGFEFYKKVVIKSWFGSKNISIS